MEATYDLDQKLIIPNLGFVIYNEKGSPITGGNPLINGIKLEDRNYPSKGKVKIKLNQPKLSPGKYFVSFWFGDGIKDSFHDPYAISFQVNNGTQVSNEWNIKSECEYEFT